jgi:hypothetical protein
MEETADVALCASKDNQKRRTLIMLFALFFSNEKAQTPHDFQVDHF